MNMEVISKLQNDNPQVFTPRAVYDSRKNLFSPKALPFGNAAEVSRLPVSASHYSRVPQFQVTLGNPPAGGRQPRPYYVRLRKVAEINPECVLSNSSSCNHLFCNPALIASALGDAQPHEIT